MTTQASGNKGKKKKRRRAPLSRDRVFKKAIGLADKGGIESLSMRKLALDLGVEAMSPSNHAKTI